VRFCDLRPGQDADVQAVLGVAPFAADRLAAIGRQGGEEVVEGLVAVVAPDELHVLTQQQPHLAHRQPFGLGREVDVQRRDAGLAGQAQSALDQGLPHGRGVGVRGRSGSAARSRG
jgi:hypothetical protein